MRDTNSSKSWFTIRSRIMEEEEEEEKKERKKLTKQKKKKREEKNYYFFHYSFHLYSYLRFGSFLFDSKKKDNYNSLAWKLLSRTPCNVT